MIKLNGYVIEQGRFPDGTLSINVDVKKLYALEERMAKSFYPKEKLRDPHANYHKMSIDEIKEKFIKKFFFLPCKRHFHDGLGENLNKVRNCI